MERAAMKNEVYHLWWHPHNFGINLKENLGFLEAVLKHYKVLHKEIGMQSRNMKESMNEMLWSIDPNNDSMEKLLLRMQEFTAGIMLVYHVDVVFNTTKKVRQLSLNMQHRHELLQFYKEGLHFTTQSLSASAVHVSIDYVKEQLTLAISATGTSGKTPAEDDSPFLPNMEKRADALGATLDISTEAERVAIRLHFAIA